MSNDLAALKASARKAAEKIASDISGRRGIGDELDSVDDEIREEMLDEWTDIILQSFK